MIDFAKTLPLENGHTLTHRDEWSKGNHEDGFLFGLDSLINIWEMVYSEGSGVRAAGPSGEAPAGGDTGGSSIV